MTLNRYRTRTVEFRHPFRLPSIDAVLPPGAYSVDEEYAQLDGVSFAVYRRVSTVLHLRTTGATHESVEVDGTALDAALLEDATSRADDRGDDKP